MERLLRQVLRALKPDGVLYLDEFIGPSRTFWNDRTVAWYRALYELIPIEARDTRYNDRFGLPVEWHDLTEAVRSGEIVSRVRIGFKIDAFRGYGGNVLAVLFPSMLPGRVSADMVRSLVAAENSLLAAGARHFYAVIVSRPKRGMARWWAELRYVLKPKARRIEREIRLRLGSKRHYASEEEAFRL